jgi:phosphopantetheine adenylyltransferase
MQLFTGRSLTRKVAVDGVAFCKPHFGEKSLLERAAMFGQKTILGAPSLRIVYIGIII